MSFIPASATSVPNNLARQDNNGKLAAGLGGGATTLATLDANTRLVEAAQLVAPVAPTTAAGAIGVDSGKLKFGDGAQVRQVEQVDQKGVANGYAGLGGDGKVPAGQLPAAVVGSVHYKGTWNANTNTPDLTASPATGDYYVVDTAGATNLSGITDWKIKDWAIFDGTNWSKIDNTDAVTSVATRTGAVVLAVGDVSGAEATANKGANNGYASLDGNGRVVQAAQLVAPLGATTAQGSIGVNNGDLTFGEGANVRTVERVDHKGAAGGYASLDGSTRLPSTQLPTVAVVADGSVPFTAVMSSAGRKRKVAAAKTADYTLTANDEGVPFDASGAARVATLPPATGSGQEYKISKEDSSGNAVTITADSTGANGGPDSINGAATRALIVQYEAVTLVDWAPNAWRIF